MEMSRKCNRNAVEIYLKCHEKLIEISQKYLENVMKMSCKCHGNVTKSSWKYLKMECKDLHCIFFVLKFFDRISNLLT